MKTPHEILFKRHQAAESKLDAIRETVVASVDDRRTANPPAIADHNYAWREFWFSLRWHLAGMGAAWLVIVLLNLNIGRSVSLASAMPREKIPSAQIILASLHENRRELLEMIQPSESREARPSKLFRLQPRSERPDETLTA
ncbi:MAG TPA: hypothetical protein VKU37_08275 [Verrucomicrobiae bacterium]|nr:hypothetical protein [Verrucomicrobiae bacterium]